MTSEKMPSEPVSTGLCGRRSKQNVANYILHKSPDAFNSLCIHRPLTPDDHTPRRSYHIHLIQNRVAMKLCPISITHYINYHFLYVCMSLCSVIYVCLTQKGKLFYLTMPLEHVDFYIIAYWTSLLHISSEETHCHHIGYSI